MEGGVGFGSEEGGEREDGEAGGIEVGEGGREGDGGVEGVGGSKDDKTGFGRRGGGREGGRGGGRNSAARTGAAVVAEV